MVAMAEEYEIIHKPSMNKFLIRLEPGKFSFLGYSIKSGKLYIKSTYTHPDYRGRGIARRLVLEAVRYARENSLKIVPVCSYAVSFFKKYKECIDVLDPEEGLKAIE